MKQINPRKTFLVFALLMLFIFRSLGQVGVNILTPHPTSAMQVETPSGSFKGLLTPSMTTVGRNNVSSGNGTPADGLIVYDTQHKMHYQYNSSTNRWVSMSPLILSTGASVAFPYPHGTITTPVSTAIFSVGINKQNPSCALDVVGNASVTGNTNIGGNLNVAGFPTNALVPVGTIVMFHGNTIPSGWAVCNGSLGTPDLRGKFIVATGQATAVAAPGDINYNYTVNSKGGENRHILTKQEIPTHHHNAVGDGATISASGGNHIHTASPLGQGLEKSAFGNTNGGYAGRTAGTIATSANTHNHPNNEFSGRVGDGAADGLNNQAHENRPQYYALIFIMKL